MQIPDGYVLVKTLYAPVAVPPSEGVDPTVFKSTNTPYRLVSQEVWTRYENAKRELARAEQAIRDLKAPTLALHPAAP